MKLILENWREYLFERYSIESSLETIKPTNKKMYKAFKRYSNRQWHFEFEHGYIDPIEEPEPPVPEGIINKAAAGYRAHIFEMIPEDIWGPGAQTQEQKKKEANKNQGLAIMWIRKLSLENPQIFADIVDGEVGDWRGPYSNVMPDLEIYFQNLDLMDEKNLINIGSFQELHEEAEAAKEEIYARQEKKQYMDAEEGTEVLRDDGEIYIAALHNKGAACELGKGTDWCTAAPGLDYFSDYYEPDDPLFFFENKADRRLLPGDKYQFHYGSEQFMDKNDRSINDELFKVLHGLLMQTEAPQKYPIVQTYHYNLVSDDPNTSPEELSEIAETLMSSAGALSSDHTWEREVLAKIAKNSRTPLETLKKLSKTDDKYVLRNISVNQQLGYDSTWADPTKEGMELAKEIFLNNIGDELIFDRGLKQVGRWVKAGIISKEEVEKVLEFRPYYARKRKRVAEGQLTEDKKIKRLFKKWRRDLY